MSECIEREALLRALSKEVEYDDDGEQEINSDTVFITIEAAPAADVARVAHGKWREDTDPADGDLRCTHCGTAWPKFVQDQIAEQGIWTLQTLFKFCPNCGAKMDKEDET